MIRQATDADFSNIYALLQAASLPTAGIQDQYEHVYVLDVGDRVIGVVAFESYPPSALLRSLVVLPDEQGKGYGHQLLKFILDTVWHQGCQRAFALTTTIPELLLSESFSEISRAAVPDEVLASVEFHGACPLSARVFCRPLKSQ